MALCSGLAVQWGERGGERERESVHEFVVARAAFRKNTMLLVRSVAADVSKERTTFEMSPAT